MYWPPGFTGWPFGRIRASLPADDYDMDTTLWPEDAPPSKPIPCDTCELASQSPTLVWGEGYPEAPLWILLDNPGSRLTTEGTSFVCGTRETLYSVLAETGFRDKDLYLTFVVRRRPRHAYDKTTERRLCIKNFCEQLQRWHPKTIICLGEVALQSLTSAADASLSQYRETWTQYGGAWLTASYHPLAVRRRPNLREPFIQDWRFVHATFPNFPPVDAHRPPPKATS